MKTDDGLMNTKNINQFVLPVHEFEKQNERVSLSVDCGFNLLNDFMREYEWKLSE